MELTIYDIIKGPRISDKAYKLNKDNSQLVLEVHVDATKPQVRNALEKLFNVKVDTVRTNIRKYRKTRGFNKKNVGRPSMTKMKIAYVTLAEGHSLNLFEQAGAHQATSAEAVQ